MTLAGRTVAVRSLDEQYVRSVDADEVPHVRRLASLVEASKIAADRARVFARIVSDPGVRFGKVCLKGTRIDVATVIGALAAGDSAEAVERAHALTHEQILDALRYAFRVVAGLPTEAGEVP